MGMKRRRKKRSVKKTGPEGWLVFYSAAYHGDVGSEAASMRDELKYDAGVRAKWGGSPYVGHRSILIHRADADKALKYYQKRARRGGKNTRSHYAFLREGLKRAIREDKEATWWWYEDPWNRKRPKYVSE